MRAEDGHFCGPVTILDRLSKSKRWHIGPFGRRFYVLSVAMLVHGDDAKGGRVETEVLVSEVLLGHCLELVPSPNLDCDTWHNPRRRQAIPKPGEIWDMRIALRASITDPQLQSHWAQPFADLCDPDENVACISTLRARVVETIGGEGIAAARSRMAARQPNGVRLPTLPVLDAIEALKLLPRIVARYRRWRRTNTADWNPALPPSLLRLGTLEDTDREIAFDPREPWFSGDNNHRLRFYHYHRRREGMEIMLRGVETLVGFARGLQGATGHHGVWHKTWWPKTYATRLELAFGLMAAGARATAVATTLSQWLYLQTQKWIYDPSLIRVMVAVLDANEGSDLVSAQNWLACMMLERMNRLVPTSIPWSGPIRRMQLEVWEKHVS